MSKPSTQVKSLRAMHLLACGLWYNSGTMRTIFLLTITALLISACGEPVPGPEPVAREVVSALAAKPPRSNLKPVYERLSKATRDALQRRADEIRKTTGNESIQDWEVLGPGDLSFGDRVSRVALLEENDESATVEVTMAVYVKDSRGDDEVETKSVTIQLLKEDGQWRVDLPLVSSNP